MVHLLLDAIELMDLSAFEAHYTKRGTDAPPFSPSMMVCVLIHAYANGHRSSRKIERLCERDAGFRMIVGDEVPDHSVIARFRKRHRSEFEALFAEVLKLCHRAGLVRLGVVALDGTKVKANASLAANRTARSLEAEVAAMVSEAEETDTAEDAMFGDERGDELPTEPRTPPERLSRLRVCLDQLRAEANAQAARQQEKIDARAAEEEATGKRKRGRKPTPAEAVVDEDAKANVTDPDSRIMKSRKGYLQGYNAQAVVTAEQIILAPRGDQPGQRCPAVGVDDRQGPGHGRSGDGRGRPHRDGAHGRGLLVGGQCGAGDGGLRVPYCHHQGLEAAQPTPTCPPEEETAAADPVHGRNSPYPPPPSVASAEGISPVSPGQAGIGKG
jgi:transposase